MTSRQDVARAARITTGFSTRRAHFGAADIEYVGETRRCPRRHVVAGGALARTRMRAVDEYLHVACRADCDIARAGLARICAARAASPARPRSRNTT